MSTTSTTTTVHARVPQQQSQHGSESTKTITSLNSFISGAVAGAVEASVTYPTEFIKTQLQLHGNYGKTGAATHISSAAATSSTTGRSTPSVAALIKETYKTKGVTGFYKGVSALITGTAAKAGVRFLTYENAKYYLTPAPIPIGPDSNGDMMYSKPKLSLLRLLVAGTISGATEALTVVTPTETIKTKLIHDSLKPQPQYKGMIHGSKAIMQEEGFSGIYRGASAVVARQAANSGVRLSTYTLLKESTPGLFGVNDVKDLPWYANFMNGAIAGIVTVYSTMPLDVVKTKMQSLDAKKHYSSSIDCLFKIVKSENVFALWKGTTPRLARLIFSGGIVFSIFEVVSQNLSPYI